MASQSRKLARSDYFLVKAAMQAHLDKMRSWPDKKQWFDHIDLQSSLDSFFEAENAYIVDDAFLVVYDIETPWYSKDTLLLDERIILRLVPGGNFTNVLAFLEERRQEAGAKLVVVGTALARHDAALASVYHKHGFKTETVVLVKGPDQEP